MAPMVWFITGKTTPWHAQKPILIPQEGCSSGFGRELVLAALARNDKVIATARTASKIEDLKEAGADIMPFDVTAPLKSLK
jgi:NADP-dependent 3-hydroxy acid dehydrogenase YdfG